MSSDYSIFCVSHDPAIEALGELSGGLDALMLAAQPAGNEQLHDHVGCDLLVGRYSGGFIQFACPGGERCKPGYHGWKYESWTEAGWLRLLHAAYSRGDLGDLSGMRLPACWSYTRVLRLGRLLGVGGDR